MEEEKGKQEVVILREYNKVRDFEMAMKLEKSCKNIGSCTSNSNEGISIFSCMAGNDPLCRIRLYPLHVMLIAELINKGEIVGMVRGCIKHVETGPQGRRQLKLGSILGLRISPAHRRKGVGLKLVKSMEEWMNKNGANYTFLATEENNVASTNLFALKCNYTKLTSLTIFVQPINTPSLNNLPEGTEIRKLHSEQAISLYNTYLQNKHIYPTDINTVLGENLSLGTWLCYLKDESVKITSRITGGSWAIFSIWNTCDAYNYKVDHCEKDDNNENPKPFGFLFIYGLIGEGKRVGELVKCLWSFALGMAENVKDCKAIMTELGFLDPLIEYVPKQALTSCIDDLWYVKKSGIDDDWLDNLAEMETVGDVFVDPRDF